VQNASSRDVLAELAETILRVARELDPHGALAASVIPLTGTEVAVMRWIDRNPGTSPTAAAEAAGLLKSNLSAALRSLVAKGMVERRQDPLDARLVQLHPTEAATQNIQRLRAHWATRLEQAVEVDAAAAALEVLLHIDGELRSHRP
jgi:DNA-binding MarR family transcriptional regulator